MFGAIIGDLAGSIYEFQQIHKVKKVKIKNIIEENSFYSDDTILTFAIADAILNGCEYEKKLREYALKYEAYSPNFKPYFEKPFSPTFLKWAKGDKNGGSSGNGAMMRISPVGWLFDKEEDVKIQAILATKPSHDTPNAIEAAQKVALFILYARRGMDKKEIFNKLEIKIKKPKIKVFNYTCQDTIDLVFWSIYKAKNFEDAIKIAISFGGDTDTNACIVGSMAEALWGVDEGLKKQVVEKLPKEFIKIIKKFEKRQKGERV